MSNEKPISLPKNLVALAAQSSAHAFLRSIYLLLGISLTIVGMLAIVLPVVPATSTLLASSLLLTKSYPSLQLWMNELPVVGKLLKYLDGTRVMTPNVRLCFGLYLWGNLLVTCLCLYCIGLASYPIVSINIFCCVLSTVFLLKFRAEKSNVSHAMAMGRFSAVNSAN